MNSDSQKIAVAMSGGVDSSVAAYLLAKEGYAPFGISMQVWDYRNQGGSCSRATCCSPDDFTDARRVAGKISIPYYVFDFEKVFEERVIQKFVRTYEQGMTPNPCVDCNSKVKFFELRNRANKIGCEVVATGHYAQISKDETGYHLLRGVDSDKDQSYFLYNLSQEELSKTLFPVGHLTKPEVREIAHSTGLPTASKPESQDICFVSGTVAEFMKRRGVEPKSGKIVDQAGKLLGEHEGVHLYTVGQRRGLKVGGGEVPLYIIEIDTSTQTVVVGPKESLERSSFSVNELNWVSPLYANELTRPKSFTCLVQLRHRHKGVKVSVKLNEDYSAELTFVDEWSTVSPGQAAVFYDLTNTEVLGGGRISQTLALNTIKNAA